MIHDGQNQPARIVFGRLFANDKEIARMKFVRYSDLDRAWAEMKDIGRFSAFF
jgi:hypothetical protein